MGHVQWDPIGLDGTAKTGSGVPQYGGNGLLFDRLWSKRDHVHRRGLAYRKTEETDLCSSSYGRNGVLLIGRGVAYRKMEDTNLCWSAYGRNGGPVHREGCGVPQNGTPWATVHPPSTASLQPPRATVHPPSTSSSLHLRLFIHGVSLLPPPATVHRRAPVHPASTGYCSTSPP